VSPEAPVSDRLDRRGDGRSKPAVISRFVVEAHHGL